MVTAVEAAGKVFDRELVDLSVSPVIRKALLESDPTLGSDTDVRELIRREFSQPTDIDTAEFLRMTREILTKGGELPLTIVVLDEVQIFVRNNLERTRQVVEVAEALAKQMGEPRASRRCRPECPEHGGAGVRLDARPVYHPG